MIQIALVLFFTFQSQPAPQDEVKDALAHAEALYYSAQFSESIQLLARVDEVLKAQPSRLKERVNAKLQLALAHIGLNETAEAQTLLTELYALDSDYVLDAQQFSPKVIAMAADAKAGQSKMQCQIAERDAQRYLQIGNTKALANLFRTMNSKCEVLRSIEPEAAESFHKTGVAAYKRGDLSEALSNFESAVMLSPAHELAFQYIDLIRSKLEVSQDRVALAWQRDFEAGRLSAAAAGYRQILSSNNQATAIQVSGEYRKALTAMVDDWNKACSSGDQTSLSAISGKITELLPEPSFGEDIRARMTKCNETSRAGADVSANAAAVGRPCFQMEPQLVLTRLQKRVTPVLTGEHRNLFKNGQITIRVRTRINENGDVVVSSIPDGNPALNEAVRSAVSQWKFAPIRDQIGPRCVDTEISITLSMGK